MDRGRLILREGGGVATHNLRGCPLTRPVSAKETDLFGLVMRRTRPEEVPACVVVSYWVRRCLYRNLVAARVATVATLAGTAPRRTVRTLPVRKTAGGLTGFGGLGVGAQR